MAKKRSSSFEELTRDLNSGAFDDYHMAMGEFISKFSEVETNLISALWYIAGVESPIAQAILTGIKIEGAIGLINRIADSKGWPKAKREAFKRFSDQLGLINKFRNDLLHNGSNWTGSQTWTVTNKFFAHVPSRIRTYPVSAHLLRTATFDLEKIHGDLVLFAWGQVMPTSTRKAFRDSVHHPWRYKPPPGFEIEQKNGKTLHKPKDQPKSSRASRRRDAMARLSSEK